MRHKTNETLYLSGALHCDEPDRRRDCRDDRREFSIAQRQAVFICTIIYVIGLWNIGFTNRDLIIDYVCGFMDFDFAMAAMIQKSNMTCRKDLQKMIRLIDGRWRRPH